MHNCNFIFSQENENIENTEIFPVTVYNVLEDFYGYTFKIKTVWVWVCVC